MQQSEEVQASQDAVKPTQAQKLVLARWPASREAQERERHAWSLPKQRWAAEYPEVCAVQGPDDAKLDPFLRFLQLVVRARDGKYRWAYDLRHG